MAGDTTRGIERTLFWQQLGSLLRGGMPLDHALEAIARDAETTELRDWARRLRAGVEDGRPLSDLLSEESRQVDTATLACVRAGERTGALPEAATVIAEHGWRDDLFRLRGRMVLTYPAILLVFTTLVAGGLFSTVFPIGSEVARDLGSDPTWWEVGTFVLGLGCALLLLVLVAFALGVIVLRRPDRFPTWSRRAEGVLLRVPWAGRYRRSLVTARFGRTLELLLRAGTPLHEALPLAGEASGSPRIADAARRAGPAVADGSPLAAALGTDPAFDDTTVWALSVGERRGDLENAVDAVASWAEETSTIASSTFLNAAEPIAVAVIGLLCSIAILVLMIPMINMYTLIP